MKLFADLKILYHMALKPVRGKDHAARLESFYSGQAKNYDDFKKDVDVAVDGLEKRNMQLKAEKVEGGWKLNGQKMWTTSAHFADWYWGYPVAPAVQICKQNQ